MVTYYCLGSNTMTVINVPARHIYEGAARCPYCLAPCPNSLAPCPIYIAPARILKKKLHIKKNYNCCFCVFRQPMNCKLLADLCPCFHRSLKKLCPDLVSFACWIVPEFWSFTCKSDLVIRALNCVWFFVRLRTKLCPNFGRSRARLCPISFAPCPFPNRAGTHGNLKLSICLHKIVQLNMKLQLVAVIQKVNNRGNNCGLNLQ